MSSVCGPLHGRSSWLDGILLHSPRKPPYPKIEVRIDLKGQQQPTNTNSSNVNRQQSWEVLIRVWRHAYPSPPCAAPGGGKNRGGDAGARAGDRRGGGDPCRVRRAQGSGDGPTRKVGERPQVGTRPRRRAREHGRSLLVGEKRAPGFAHDAIGALRRHTEVARL